MKRAHDLSLTQVNHYLASYIEYINVKIKNNEMKEHIKIINRFIPFADINEKCRFMPYKV